MGIPVIDFTKLEQNKSDDLVLVKSQIKQALEEFGCFEAFVSSKIISQDLQMSTFYSLEELFNLPVETKKNNVIDGKPFYGYLGQVPAMPLHETLAIDDPTSFEMIDNFTNICWPQGNPSFSKTIQDFTKQISEFEKLIRSMIFEGFGVEKYAEEHMNSTEHVLKLMKYGAPQTDEATLGLICHRDKNVVTILYQNEIGGLEVQKKDGEWISWTPSANSFMVVVGESLHAWLNGRVHPPYHKVMMKGDKTRYSLGLFAVYKFGYIVKAPQELVDEDHPLLYKPFDFHGFQKFREAKVLRNENGNITLKDYCGI